jgi:hypothetical protein
MTTSQPNPIAGVVLPLAEAEGLMRSLPGVVSAKMVARADGSLDAIHVLVTGELAPKQVVRNIESALIAQLGLRVDHRKISVATMASRDPDAPTGGAGTVRALPLPVEGGAAGGSRPSDAAAPGAARAPIVHRGAAGRSVYFEDVEFRGSRSRGSSCRVTLRRGEQTWQGEAEGIESARSRSELAARAALQAVRAVEGGRRPLELIGVKRLDAFETTFVFVAVETWLGRERALLTGSCELRDSAEVSAVLAVLDATNRWLEQAGS